jgi:hypothetical protein
MSNKEDLNKTLKQFFKLAHQCLLMKEEQSSNKIIPLKGKKDKILCSVSDIELSDIFDDLIELTREEYAEVFFNNRSDHWDDTFDDIYSDWRFLIKVFFRKSGFYLDIYNNININEDFIIKKYHECFKIREVNVRILAPLEFVDITPKKPINFENFSIRKFSVKELQKISNNDINLLFFPESVWDVNVLADYWFLDIPNHKVGTDCILQSDWTLIFFKNKRHDLFIYNEIKDMIYPLVLYNWKSSSKGLVSQGVNIPFVSIVDNYFLAYPDDSPDISKLKCDMSRVEFVEGEIFDKDFNRSKLRKRTVYFKYNRKERDNFIGDVTYITKLFNNSILKNYPFIEKALEYCMKGLFIYEPTKASEQLLWHVIAIESMLSSEERFGENTKIMCRRISSILGKDDDERKKLEETFEKIYRIRSRLVHGSLYDEQQLKESLYEVREMSRKCCIWFLKLFDNLKKDISGDQIVPTIKDIFQVLDRPDVIRQAIESQYRVYKALP